MKLDPKSESSFWLLVVLLFALLTGVMYFPALLGKVPFPRDMVLQFPTWNGMVRSEAWQPHADIGDLITYFYPFRAIAGRAVHQGTLPLWNPYFLGGAPFLASPQSSLFYPPNFLYYLLSLPTAWTLCLMLRMFLSGTFMTMFVRSIGGTRAGSIFSGVIFSMCGFMTAWQGQPMGDGAVWLPFVCYAVIRLQKQPSRFSIALASFGFAMPVLAGHPESAAHVTLVGVVVALVTWACSDRDNRYLLRFASAGLLAIGLSSIQIIPTLEWLGQMPAALDIRWPVLTLHDALGWVSRDIVRAPNSAGIWIPETAAYVGMLTLLAAPIGIFHRSRRHVVFLSGLIFTAIAIAYGIEPIHWLVAHTPVLAGLKNGRMIFVAGFGLAALAGLGISALEEDQPFPYRRRVIALTLLSIVFLFTFLLVYKLRLDTTFRVEFTRRPSFSRSLLFIGLIPLLWRLYGGVRGRAFAIICCAVVGFDLMTFGYRYTGFATRDEIFPPAPLFDFLAKQHSSSHFRVASMGVPYSPNANIMFGIPSADGYESRLIPPHLAFSLDYADNSFPGISFLTPRLLMFKDRRLDMLNVKYLAAGTRSPEYNALITSGRFPLAYDNGYVALFENKTVLPRAFAVPIRGAEVLSAMDQQLERLRDPAFDPQQTVLLSKLSPSLKTQFSTPRPPGSLFTSNVAVSESNINDVSLRTSTSESAVLVVSQTYYPGWQATVDGRAADIFPVNVTLTGIALPSGAHEVRLAFRPLSFKVGAALTLVAAVVLVLLVFG